MKVLRAASVLVLSAFTLTGCDDATGVEIADLAGVWNATQFEYSEIGGAGFSIDAITQAQGTVTLDVQANGSFTGTVRIPGLTVNPADGSTVTIPIGGTISLINDSNLAIDFNSATEALGFFGDFDAAFTLSGDTLTFINEDTQFDFPDALEVQALGAARGPVPVDLTVTLVR